MSLVTNTRTHTRNEISASAETGKDKDARSDIPVGQREVMKRQRWRNREEGRKTKGLDGQKDGGKEGR